jgi:hypothetical protein
VNCFVLDFIKHNSIFVRHSEKDGNQLVRDIGLRVQSIDSESSNPGSAVNLLNRSLGARSQVFDGQELVGGQFMPGNAMVDC